MAKKYLWGEHRGLVASDWALVVWALVVWALVVWALVVWALVVYCDQLLLMQ